MLNGAFKKSKSKIYGLSEAISTIRALDSGIVVKALTALKTQTELRLRLGKRLRMERVDMLTESIRLENSIEDMKATISSKKRDLSLVGISMEMTGGSAASIERSESRRKRDKVCVCLFIEMLYAYFLLLGF